MTKISDLNVGDVVRVTDVSYPGFSSLIGLMGNVVDTDTKKGYTFVEVDFPGWTGGRSASSSDSSIKSRYWLYIGPNGEHNAEVVRESVNASEDDEEDLSAQDVRDEVAEVLSDLFDKYKSLMVLFPEGSAPFNGAKGALHGLFDLVEELGCDLDDGTLELRDALFPTWEEDALVAYLLSHAKEGNFVDLAA